MKKPSVLDRLDSLPRHVREKLLARLARDRGAAKAPEAAQVHIPRVSRDERIVASYAQERMYVLWELLRGEAGYHLSSAVDLRGPVDAESVVEAFRALVERHETLRTALRQDDAGVYQVILPVPENLDVGVEDLSALPPDARESAVVERAGQLITGLFDLERGEVVRARVFRLEPERHVVVWVCHHVATDGVSDATLIPELLAFYQARVERRSPALPPLEVQYADYSVWQRRWLESGELDRQITFWTERLSDVPRLELPLDRPRPAMMDTRGAACELELPLALVDRARVIARDLQASELVVWLSIASALLALYGSQEDVSVGTVVSGRRASGLESLIGFFVNTLVIRSQVDPSMTFGELARQLRGTFFDALEHQDAPFERVVRAVAPDRDLSANPLFQVLVTTMDLTDLPSVGPIEARPFSLGTTIPVRHDLRLSVTHRASVARLRIDYRTALFDASTIERLGQSFVRLASAAFADLDAPLARLPLSSDAEREAWRRYNDTRLELESRRRLHDPFEQSARLHPDRVAVIDPVRTLSYGALDRAANRIARCLVERGVGRGDRVLVVMPKSGAATAALLGILKAGGTYVPLDESWPAARVADVQETAHAVAACVERADAPALSLLTGLPRVVIGESTFTEGAADAPACAAEPDDLAYIIFTSGSTGRPKGVMIEHAAALNTIEDVNQRHSVGPNDRIFGISALTFDLSVWDIFGAFAAGAAVVFPPASEARDASHWWRSVRDHGVTIWSSVPALVDMLVAYSEQQREGLPERLRLVMMSGDWIPVRLPNRLRALRPTLEVISMGGATEASIWSIWYPIGEVQSHWRSIPYGRPMANQGFHVLNAALELCGFQVVGELYISGVGLARGYAGDEERTAASFFVHPRMGERLYRTGDFGRLLPSGDIEFLGRRDAQVKIRGFRIELGDIEAALRSHRSVNEVLATVREHPSGGRHIVAYVVPADGGADGAALRELATAKLPSYMLPSAIVTLDAFPLTANGKVDRRALPDPDWGAGGGRAASSEAEKSLAAIVEELLALDDVGVDQNLFDAGLDSLLATRLVQRARAQGLELAIRDVFEAPQIDDLARRAEARADTAPPLTPVDRGAPPRASFAQARLWFIDRLTPESAAYHIPAAFRVEGELEVAALRSAFAALMERHEVLRTSLVETREGLVQNIADTLELPWGYEDHSGRAEEETSAAVREVLTRPFDLSQAPLWRVAVFRIAPREHVLALVMHHVISDGWSVGVIVRELGVFYAAAARGASAALPPLPVQYADYAEWQRRWLEGGELDRQLAYWRERLSGAPPVLELPLDRARPKMKGDRGGSVPVRIERPTVERVEALARELGATPFMVLLAAWQLLLGQHARTGDIVVGAPIAGRRHEAVEGLIGFFVNTLALRTRWRGDPTFSELVERVKEVTLGAYAHQDVPFEKLVSELNVPRDTSITPVFQVMFVLQNAPGGERTDLAGIRLSRFGGGDASEKFDLTLTLDAGGPEGMEGTLSYDASLFEPATAESLAGAYAELLSRAVRTPAVRVSTHELGTEAERARLASWNATERPLEDWPCLHEAFERQVDRTPNAVALLDDGSGRSLTYAEMDARANGVAARLRELGVGVESRVGVCLERSADLVVAIHGVLKAGGAYVPMDPSLPASRLEHMARDTEMRALLVHDASAAVVSSVAAQTLRMEDCAARAERVESGVRPWNAAYVLFTSGSTGQPKGAVNTHGAVWNRLRWQHDAIGLGAGDTVLHKTPYSFDVSVWELFWALQEGARLVIARPEAHRDPEYLQSLMVRESVDVVHFVPSMLSAFLEAPPVARPRAVVVSGEALSYELKEQFYARYGESTLYNVYGPTEAAVDVSLWRCEAGDARQPVPIGAPVWNTELHVMDEWLRPQVAGVPGELCIGGVQVSRGYQSRPSLTASLFVPDPTSERGGERLYRTGDLSRWARDGQLLFLGRLDFQVKLRGFRIELGEIEAALESSDAIATAVVVARSGPSGVAQLVAYVRPSKEGALDIAAEAERLQDRLPEYMVPQAWVELSTLPLTPSGKIDRRALPAPINDVVGEERPRTPREHLLEEIARGVLGIERVPVDVSLFALGLDSILATQLVWRAKERGVSLRVRDVFEHPTVAGLARAARSGASARERGPIVGAEPLTPIQAWFFEQALPQRSWWNQSLMLRVPRSFDPDALEAILERLVAHHDQLRARFTRADGLWRQELLAPGENPILLRRERIVADDAEERARLVEAIAEELQSSLSLEEGRCIAVAHVDVGDEARVIFVAHHLVIDAVSWRVLAEDMHRLWRGRPLPDKTSAFADWAERMQAAETLQAFESELSYWQASTRALPALWAETGEGNGERATATVTLDPRETETLTARVAPRWRADVQEILVAALSAAVARASARAAVPLTIEGHGREDRFDDLDVTRTVGWFTAIYPVVIELEGADALEALMRAKAALRAVPGRGLGYGALRYGSESPEVRESLRYQSELTFNYLGQVDRGIELADGLDRAPERTGADIGPDNPRTDPLLATASIVDGCLHLRVDGDRRLGKPTVDEVASAWSSALRELATVGVSAPLRYAPTDFPNAALSQRELDALLPAGSEVDAVYPLTPLQSGIVFETRLAPDAALYVDEHRFELRGDLDEAALERAWRLVHARHEALRASIHDGGLSTPHMVVWRDAPLRFDVLDLRKARDPESTANERCDALRREGFALSSAPSSRVLLVRIAEGRWWLSWMSHHAILDGWSAAIVMGEVMQAAGAMMGGTEHSLRPAQSLAPVVAWQRREQARASSSSRWAARLEGARLPTHVGVRRGISPAQLAESEVVTITVPTDERTSRALRALASECGVTAATLLTAGWSLVCSATSGRNDVTFGFVVSGRTPEVASSESMVGMLINALPMRVRLDLSKSVADWARELMSGSVSLQSEAYVALSEVAQGAGVRSAELFDSLLVFENYPIPDEIRDGAGNRRVSVEALSSRERPPTPLSVIGHQEGERLFVRVEYQSALVDAPLADRAARWLTRALEALAQARADAPVGSLRWLDPDEPSRLAREWREHGHGSEPDEAWRRWSAQSWGWGAEWERQVAYWRERLATLPAALDLGQRARAAEAVEESVEIRLGPELSERIDALSVELGARPFAILLAAWQLVLAHYAHAHELVIGVPAPARSRVEERAIAPMLPLCLDASGDPTFAELVARTEEVAREAQSSSDVPLEKLMELVGGEGDPAVSPLAQLSFALAASEEPPVLFSPFGGPRSELGLTLARGAGGYAGALAFDGRLFTTDVVERLARALHTVLRSSLDAPMARASALELSTEDDAQRLEGWSRPAMPVSEAELLPALFERRARETPEAVVAGSGSRTWTYAELSRRASALAFALSTCGVGLESRVGLSVASGLDRLVGMVGIWKAGAAYVPLDPTYPASRLAWMGEDAGVSVCVCSEGVEPPSEMRRLGLEEVAGSGDVVEPPLMAANAAYVIYTSGSTGRPKGVVVSHGSVAAHAQAMESELGLSTRDRVSQLTSLSFDVAVEEICPTLRAGGSVWFRPEGLMEPRDLLAWCADAGVTVLQLPAPLWHEMASAIEGSHVPPTLRLLVVGSDRVQVEAYREWCSKVGARVGFRNAYGPTEATVTATLFDPVRAEVVDEVPIGRPVGHARAYLTTEWLRRSPLGGLGELLLGGAGVARSYLARPGLTASRFVPDPFSEEPGARAYRTGDLARWSIGGELRFRGRSDEQIKVRGFRIEPGEIEAALESSEAIARAVVASRPGPRGVSRLVAYVVPSGGGALELTTEADRLRARLPEHMLPQAWVELSALPLTPNGKIDRRALPEPQWQASSHEPPSTPTEEALAEIWCEVLGVPRVGRTDSFFDLGGHSLLAMRAANAVRERFGLELEVAAVFAAPTLEGVARAIDEKALSTIAANARASEALHDFDAEGLEAMSDEELDAVLGITGDDE